MAKFCEKVCKILKQRQKKSIVKIEGGKLYFNGLFTVSLQFDVKVPLLKVKKD